MARSTGSIGLALRHQLWPAGAVVLTAASYVIGPVQQAAPGLLTRIIAAGLGVTLGAAAVAVFRTEGWGQKAKAVLVGLLGVGMWLGYLVEPKIRSTMRAIGVAIALSLVVFVGANLWFNLSRSHWRVFGAVSGGVVMAGLTGMLVGNRILAMGSTSWLVPVLGGLAGAGFGVLLASLTSPRARVIGGMVGGAVLGGVILIFLRPQAYPAIRSVDISSWPAGLAVAGAAISGLRRRRWWPGAVGGAAVGVFVAVWLASVRFGGAMADAVVGTVGVGGLAGLRLGANPAADYRRRIGLEQNARAAIFLAPALLFILVTLLVPTIRTIYLSFLDDRSKNPVGLKNYIEVFTDRSAVDLSGWADIFTSRLFVGGVLLLLLGAIAGVVAGRRVGGRFEGNGASVGPVLVGIFLLAFAVFSNLRGTVFNNLWWVFTVTVLATSLGLAIAVLADRAAWENVAKAIIFVPMAISFVGASIIWRFVYIARPVQKDQTGILNALWVWLGRTSTSQNGRLGLLVVFGAVLAGCIFLALRARRAGAGGVLFGSGASAALSLFLIYRVLGPGLGGIAHTVGDKTYGETIIFTQEAPFNNVWLMVVLIWIQTGFTMVIFSAAIKAVPADMIEASRVDGASESQTFWRVIMPQITPTVGVVTTTLVVLVMKVFDVVKVITNGNFGTQVIANLMWIRGFSQFDIGLGSTLAVVLFLSVLPVMIINIRRMQKEAR